MKNTLLYALTAVAGIAAASTPSAYCRSLTPEEALSRALEKVNSFSKPMRTSADLENKASDYHLAYTSNVPGTETPGCYLFKSADGFIIASADDRAKSLLGYSDDTTVDPDNLSPEFEYWLGEYGREMATVPDVPDADQGIELPTESITPICTTKWNQFGPYYDLCSQEYGQPVVTGCVATALAQVLKVHNWPPTGEGEITYHSDGKTFSFDYATADFDWDAMLDTYHRDSPEKSKAAVAELMYAAGVAVGMHYHPGGSGADPAVMTGSLPEHMKYDISIYNAQRMYYTMQEWTDLIYSQLQKGRPVQYSGYVSSGGGHSFVCDGYSHDGYFHINWGWGGASDGYYLLTALSPDHRGIGPAEARGGFNFNQDAIINIFPAEENSRPWFGVMNADSFGVAQHWAWAGHEIGIRGIYWNTGSTRIDGQFGVEAISTTGDTIIMEGRKMDPYGINEAIGGYSVRLPENLPAGEYTLKPIFNFYGEWLPIMTAVNSRSEETMTVVEADGKMKAVFSQPAEEGSITATDLDATENINPKHYFSVKATISNTTPAEWIGAISAALYTTDNQLIAYGMRMELDLLPDTEEPLDYASELKHVELPDSLKDGPAYIKLIDFYSKKPISSAVKVNIVDGLVTEQLPSPAESAKIEGIYTLQGTKIGRNESDIATLPKGIYILATRDGRTLKIAR